MAEFSCILLDVEDGIATITINRPDALNALNEQTLLDINAAIDAIEADDSVSAVMLTGSGERAFVAGADIAAMQGMSPREGQAFSRLGSNIFRRLENLPVPVAAAVNGFALGGGCELMLSCDFAYAADTAKFGQPEVKLGLIAGFGGTQRLTRKVPWGMAMELLLSGRMIDAGEALRIGLVNGVVPAEELLQTTRKALSRIQAQSPVAVGLTKRTMHAGAHCALDDALNIESAGFGECFGTDDAAEGIAAFIEKRRAKFPGR